MGRIGFHHRCLGAWLLLFSAGCASEATEPHGMLSVSATSVVTVIRPTEIQTMVNILNPTSHKIEFGFWCGGGVNIVSLADSLGPPVWSSNPGGSECENSAELQTLNPGEVLSYTYFFQAAKISREVVPDGAYRIDAVVPFTAGAIHANAGRITISR
jgi:hypothetical protein